MSDRKEIIWFGSNTSTHWDDAIAAGAIAVENITAQASNHVRGGDIPGDGHPDLNGMIESITVKIQGTKVPVDVVFFASAGANDTNLDDDTYIDHASFASSDFMTIAGETPDIHRAAQTGLSIPYFDNDKQKQFHVGIRNASGSTALGASNIVVQFGWRQDLGES